MVYHNFVIPVKNKVNTWKPKKTTQEELRDLIAGADEYQEDPQPEELNADTSVADEEEEEFLAWHILLGSGFKF